MSNVELPRYVKVGDVADISLLHTHSVMRDVGLNPDVVVDFIVGDDCVACGIEHASKLLEDVLPDDVSRVWAVKEGARVKRNTTILRVSAPYAAFVSYQSSICGLLSAFSGWASAARECVEASGGKNVIASCVYTAHPAAVADMEYAATVGGCVSVSTPLSARVANVSNYSNISVPLIIIAGGLPAAMREYHRVIPVEVARTARLGVLKDEVEDALAVVADAESKVRRFLIGTHPNRGGITAGRVKEVRAHLASAGYADVDIIAAGGLTPAIIRELTEHEAPVTAFMVGRYIAGAAPTIVAAEITQIDNEPRSRLGIIPGEADDSELENIL